MDAAPGHSVCVFAINTGPGSGTSVGCRRVEDPLALLRTTGGLTGPVPASATGRLAVVPGSTNQPREARRTVRAGVEVEAGLPVDGAVLADVAMTTLNGTRGWGADGSVTFRPDRRRGRRPALSWPRPRPWTCCALPCRRTAARPAATGTGA